MDKTERDRSEQGAKNAGVGDGTSPTPPREILCTGVTKYGRPCPNAPQPDKDVCWHHDPELAERRSRNARAGGRAMHSPGIVEIQELKDELKALARDVKEGRVAPAIGTVLNQIMNTIIRAVEQERKVRETEEFEERLAALEGRRNGSAARPAA
ncbi:MAG: hypothetical protein CYG60_21560 [Actinobacteria bacterium]|nr:MAG: hypothetical protein CYG60_21560 [Actinomycetota bacterium]